MNIILNEELVEKRRKELRNERIRQFKNEYIIPSWMLEDKIRKIQLKGEKLETSFFKLITKFYTNNNKNNVTIFKNYIFNYNKNEIDLLILIENFIIIIELKDWKNAKEIIIEDTCEIVYKKEKFVKEKFIENIISKQKHLEEILSEETVFYNILYINNSNVINKTNKEIKIFNNIEEIINFLSKEIFLKKNNEIYIKNLNKILNKTGL